MQEQPGHLIGGSNVVIIGYFNTAMPCEFRKISYTALPCSCWAGIDAIGSAVAQLYKISGLMIKTVTLWVLALALTLHTLFG